MKRYEKYKPTGIQWLPEIPEHWKIENFGKHFSFGKGLPITKADLTKEGIAVISYGQVHSKLNLGVTLSDSLIRYVSNRWLDTNPQNLLRKCDFVFADTSEDIAGAGNCAFNDYSKPLFAGYHIVIARPTMVENSRYWAYLFQSNCWKSQVQSLVNGVKVYSINKSILKKTAILIPSIAEQEKIVAYLDKRISLIENCKCQRERSLQTLNELKQAEIASVVTRGLNPDVPMVYMDTPLKTKHPSHWKRVRNMTFLIEQTEKVGKQADDYQLLSLTTNGIIVRDVESGKGKFPKDFESYKVVEPGELVFCLFDIDETPRTIGLSQNHGMITGAYDVFKVKEDIVNPSFVYAFYLVIDNIKALKPYYSGLRKVVKHNRFMQIGFALPPIEEQNAIVEYIESKTSKIDTMIEALKAEIDRLTEYKQRLISDVVTGQIDVRGEQI